MAVKKSKTKVDQQQSKDIRMLKRMIPVQREVVTSTNSTFAGGSSPVVSRLTPVALDDQKLLIRGLDFRGVMSVPHDTTGTDPIFYRYIILIYKCDVSHTAGTPSVTEPTAADVMNLDLNIMVATPNASNSSRIRILYDSMYNLQPPTTYQSSRNFKVFFKKPLNHFAVNDRAFVHRPFLIKLSNQSAAIANALESIQCDVHTTQLP